METSLIEFLDSRIFTPDEFLFSCSCFICGNREGRLSCEGKKEEKIIVCSFHRKILFNCIMRYFFASYLSSLHPGFCTALLYSGKCNNPIYKDKKRCEIHLQGGLESLNFFY